MAGGFSFGDLKKKKSGGSVQGTPQRAVVVSEPTPKSNRNRIDWKKKHEDLEIFVGKTNQEFEKALSDWKKKYENISNAFEKLEGEFDKRVAEVDDMQDKMDMLRQQESHQKNIIDMLTQEAEKFKFRPQQYSELSQLLISMRVRGNRAQKQTVIDIVGTTDIVEVRKYIFKLLEAPYK